MYSCSVGKKCAVYQQQTSFEYLNSKKWFKYFHVSTFSKSQVDLRNCGGKGEYAMNYAHR